MCQVSSDCTRTCSINRGESHGPVPDRERRRIDFPRARARPQGDRPRPGRLRIRAEQFPGLIYRIKEPKTAILLFRSGKVVCTGAKSLENVKTAIDLVAKQIEAAGIPIKKNPEIEVQNIVATSDLGAPLDLNAVAITLGPGAVEYEPEQFPGLVYRIDEPKVVLLMFGSGKVVCTGARKPADVETAVEKITAELKANGLLH